jgi:LysM repeat protein
MNTPSPLVPQGTQPKRGKSSLYFKVLMILTVHVVLIGGMLLQGCKDTSKEQTKDPALSQAGGDTTSPSNSVATADTSVPAVSTSAMSNTAVATMPPTQPVATQPTPVPAPMASTSTTSAATPAPASAPVGDGKDYMIAKGDTLAAIAKRNSVSLKALMDANPGVNAKKLKIGQKLQLPASTGAVAATSSGSTAAPASVDAASGSTSYVVKSGDTLGKIARMHGTSYKKIMALNDLKTTAIRVGQKLKMPSPKLASAETTTAPATTSHTPGPVSAISTPTTGVAN